MTRSDPPSRRSALLRLRPRPRWLAAAALAAAAVLGVFAAVWMQTCGLRGCPSVAEIRAFRPPEGSTVLDRSGARLGRLAYVRRINVPIERVPEHVRAAFIATEDRRFYRHRGVDWRAAVRAAWRNLTSLAVREGFSTITMQVVRNAFVPHLAGERTFGRKLIELGLARRLERALTKDEILELYLNMIYLGAGTYGVEATSRDLFGKSVARVTLAEAATLAALPKAPSVYSPRRNLERTRARRDLVLSLMRREGYVTPAREARAREAPIRLAREGWRPKADASQVLDPVRAFVDSVLGDRLAGAGDVTVHTTVDARAQRAAEEAVRVRAAAIERQAGRARQPVEGALVALDPRSGEIRALVGSRRYQPRGFNRALHARRQPGSAFKPFVFAAALAEGYTPATLVDDSPIAIEDDSGNVWRPANSWGEYEGPITMRRALMRSANAAAVRLGLEVGQRRVIGYARRSGIRSRLGAVPSLALGTYEVTPLELVAAYAPFANGGLRVRPHLVKRIVAGDGTVLWEAKPPAPERVLGAAEAFQITSMLRSVVDGGTAYPIRALGVRAAVAGKTGTTDDGTDVWFVGYTPTLVAGVWFGYDAPRSLGYDATGGHLAAPAWARFYNRGWDDAPDRAGWRTPPGMVSRAIDPYTGELAGEWCPMSLREWFKEGTEPTRRCREHPEPFFEHLRTIGREVLEWVKDF